MDSNSVGASVNTLIENSKVVSSLIGVVSAMIYAIATIFAALVVIYGIRSWRKEFRGKRQIELAEDVLELFYNIRDAIEAIRYPLYYEDESSIGEGSENENEEKKLRDRANIVYKRYKERQDIFNKLYAMRYRFMARIGKDKVQPFEEIRTIIRTILVSADDLAQLWVECYRYSNTNRLPSCKKAKIEELKKSIKEFEKVFWWSGTGDDISRRVDDAVSAIDETCNSIIRKDEQK